jgi:prepilin-type N-terminal cleavage/methylation domain-containing protein
MSVRKGRSRQGFTLIELMIALTAGAFAVVGVYYLGNMSARAYNEQMRMGDAQMSLRTAIDQVRRDFARAGYLAARNVNTDLSECSGDVSPTVANGVPIQAVEVRPDESMTTEVKKWLNDSVNLTRADAVRLVGNYTTSDSYMAGDVTDTTIRFQTTRDSFRRSFYDPGIGGGEATYNEDRFIAAFSNQWVRVERGGRFWFRRVTTPISSAEGAQMITITPALPACAPGKAIVSPISRIAYTVEEIAPGGELARLRVGSVAGAERVALVRRQVDVATGAPIAGTTRLVLDYAVEFAVDAVVSTAVPGTFERATAGGAGGTLDLDTVSTTNPETFRALRVTLSARTPEGNPRLPRIRRSSLDSPFVAFRINTADAVPPAPDAQLWAAVRTLRTEIFLPNLVAVPQ